jgi:hypothetical protein
VQRPCSTKWLLTAWEEESQPGRAGSWRTSEEAKVKSLGFILSAQRSQWNIFRQGNYTI